MRLLTYPDGSFTSEQLKTLRHSLSAATPQMVRHRYEELFEQVCFYSTPTRLPPPRLVQEFVSVWRVMWAMKQNHVRKYDK